MRDKLCKWWRNRQGWRFCPCCHKHTLRWHKDWVLHPEEPPLFYHWQCHNPECLVSTEIQASMLLDQAAQEKGYSSFNELMNEG